MEDKDIQQLFQAYQPKLSSEREFMSMLTASMRKVEFLKRQQEAVRRQNRIAVAVSAVTGFMTGVVFMLLMPYISAFIDSVAGEFFSVFRILVEAADPVPVLSWITVGMTTVLLSISSYHVALSIQKTSI